MCDWCEVNVGVLRGVLMLLKLMVNIIVLLGEVFDIRWGMWLQILLILFALFSYRIRPYIGDSDNFLEQTVMLMLAVVMSIVNSVPPGNKRRTLPALQT